jgi:DNA polymerase III subunit beta
MAMKFRCERDDLLEAVQFASRAISNRATLPVLSGLRIEAGDGGKVGVAATDLELTMETSLSAAVDEPGVVVVPGRLFGDMSRSLSLGQVSLAGGEGEVEIASGRGTFHVKAMAVEDYPSLPTRSEDDSEALEIEMDAATLGVALSQVVRSASTEETRQVLTGVLWEVSGDTLTLAATDSYRLGVRRAALTGDSGGRRDVILPARVLAELGRALQGLSGAVSVRLSPNFATFTLGHREGQGELTIGSRFIEGEFPKYRQLIPEGYENALDVGRDELMDVVKRVGLLAQNNMPVKLRLSQELEVSAHTPDVGEGQDVLEASYEGEPLVIAFNPRFLLDGVAAIQSDKVTLLAVDGLRPAIIRAEGDESYTYLLMPVRLS